jgi:hypothetical protein
VVVPQDTRSPGKGKQGANFSTKAPSIGDFCQSRASNVSPVHHTRETAMRNKEVSCKALARRQRGQGMSEYIIITALVAVAGIGLFAAFGDVLQNQMAGMSREMAGQSATQDISDAQASATTAQNRAAQADSLSTYNQQSNAAQ